jgi:hypothetical protein
MVLAVWLAGAMLAPQTHRLDYKDGLFRLLDAGGTEVVTASVAPTGLPSSWAYRKGDLWIVWDKRGLTVRKGSKVLTSKLNELTTSPKLFARDAILDNQKLFRSGARSKDPAGLSGRLVHEGVVYLVPRWQDKEGRTWLEALISIDPASATPKWAYRTKLQGFTLANKGIEDRLFVREGRIAALTKLGAAWGLSEWDPLTDTASARLPLGVDLDEAVYRTRHDDILAVERTGYGTRLLYRVDPVESVRKPLTETRGEMRFVLEDPAVVFLNDGRLARLRTASTGAELTLTQAHRSAPMGQYVVVWRPAAKPVAAALYDPLRWRVLATWTAAEAAKKPPAQAGPKPGSGSRPSPPVRQPVRPRP